MKIESPLSRFALLLAGCASGALAQTAPPPASTQPAVAPDQTAKATAEAKAVTPSKGTTPGAARAAARNATLDDSGDEEIVVTGQKPVGSVVGDIPPEQTLSPADVRAYGVSSISDLLDQLSPQTTSVRGRGGEQPVVLLNGRRISSFMEIRDLPTEAILRVEILPEEVALKYGFSADQKVVNFVLRQRFRSKTLEGNAGTTTEGGGVSGNGEAGLVRILRDNRLNIDAKLSGSDQILESQRGLDSLGPDGTDISPYRTLRPRTRTATVNTVFARPISKAISATINALVTATDSNALNGPPTAILAVPAGSPFGNAASLTTIGRTLGTDPLTQYNRSISEHAGFSVNGMIKSWRWFFTGNYDHADALTRNEAGVDTTKLQARLNARDPTVNPNGDLTSYLGQTLLNRARSISNSGNVQMVANGKLFELPGGAVQTTLKAGGTFTEQSSSSERLGITQNFDLSRKAGNGSINLDVPLTSRRNDFLSAIGNLTANANIAVNRLSDFGTLKTYGYGLNWTPRTPLTLIASFTDDQLAPTVAQLGNPVVVTAQSRVFDYLHGTTVDVSAISGGNPSLTADDRRVYKLGATWKPMPKQDLTINVNYVRSRIRDAIATLPEPTADLERAFPDRFVRDADGNLIRIDTRATNLSSEDTQSLRWGFNLSLPLKPSQAAIDAFRKAIRERLGNNPFGQRPPGAQGDAPPPPPPADGAPPPGDGGAPGANARGNGGFGGGPGGGGGFGGPPGGGGGFGGPPGGGGGFGGGGRGGGANRFQQNAGGRLMITVFHTWTIEDKVMIRPGVPTIDLLNGGSIGSTGGQPRHQIDAQLGYSNNGIGARLSETWKSGTRVDAAAGSAAGDLHFSSLATTDLRLFFNVGQMPKFIGAEWARNLRVTFAVSNIFDQRQHIRDALGDTPVRYLGPYLDPAGRAVTIGIRKLFSPLPIRPPARPQQN